MARRLQVGVHFARTFQALGFWVGGFHYGDDGDNESDGGRRYARISHAARADTMAWAVSIVRFESPGEQRVRCSPASSNSHR